MKLLRALLSGNRRRTAPRTYTVTVPAPLSAATVVALRRPGAAEARPIPSLPKAANA